VDGWVYGVHTSWPSAAIAHPIDEPGANPCALQPVKIST
jgi:hypothetical protein